MTDALAHRGPDARGIWLDRDAGVGLGHRRLSILDLSSLGRQPMLSRSGRTAVVFNGEVFNFEGIRRELDDADPIGWRGSSDTEVVIEACERWGVERAVQRFVGMFALAVWERTGRRLHLVRDRIGIKPLVWAPTPRGLIFASELSALRRCDAFDASVDRESLLEYARYGCVPAPRTIHPTASKVMPGTILTFHAPDAPPSQRIYWSAAAIAREGARTPIQDAQEAEDRLHELLSDAVKLRLVSDVPLGAFLSGGIDSSTVVALMQAQSSLPVRTFSIGSALSEYDESAAAAAVARHLGTDHTALRVSAEDALSVVPDMSRIYDEPFADSSQIPTYLVSRLARSHVTVALSGDGGDELFAGYNRHVWGPRIWRAARLLPLRARRAMSTALMGLSPDQWQGAYDRARFALPAVRLAGRQAHKIARALPASSPEMLYRTLRSFWDAPEALVLGAHGSTLAEEPWWALSAGGGDAERMMGADLVSYLPDDVLTKVDRASMAVGLEARVPLLDHRVVELASRVPIAMKVRDGRGKWLLRRVLARHVPPQLVDRPKMGFAVPIGAWLRGPLRPWAEALLDRRRLNEDGFLNADLVHQRWSAHVTGRMDAADAMWTVLMFQAWRQESSRD